jgi:hypothetical protein
MTDKTPKPIKTRTSQNQEKSKNSLPANSYPGRTKPEFPQTHPAKPATRAVSKNESNFRPE